MAEHIRGFQYISDVSMENQVGFSFHFGPGLIDYDQILSVVCVGESGSRAYLQGSSSDDQAIGFTDHGDGVLISLLGKKFPVKRYVRPYHTAAFRAFRYYLFTVKNEVLIKSLPA